MARQKQPQTGSNQPLSEANDQSGPMSPSPTEDDIRMRAYHRYLQRGAGDIIDFVKAEGIDDRFFETPYYLVPAKGGDRSYALLREAIRESKRVGIAKFILRDAQHLAAVEVIGDAIVLTIMRFADELVDAASFDFPKDKDVRKTELDMAKALVNSLAAEWDRANYT